MKLGLRVQASLLRFPAIDNRNRLSPPISAITMVSRAADETSFIETINMRYCPIRVAIMTHGRVAKFHDIWEKELRVWDEKFTIISVKSDLKKWLQHDL